MDGTRSTEPALATADGHARYVPDLAAPAVQRDLHESRYAWVAETFARADAAVLDLGCGAGYGARHLAEVASAVVAADPSAAAIAYARTRYPAANLTHVVVDPGTALADTLGPRRFDLVMSAEVLEHVRNPFAHAADLAAVCADDGVAVVCTPNRWFRYAAGHGGLLDPSHVMELTPDALVALLGQSFAEVTLRYQVWPPSAAPTVPPRRPGLARRVARGVRRATAAFAAEVTGDTRASVGAARDAPVGIDQAPSPAGATPDAVRAVASTATSCNASSVDAVRAASAYRSVFTEPAAPEADPPPGAVGLVAVCRGPRLTRRP